MDDLEIRFEDELRLHIEGDNPVGSLSNNVPPVFVIAARIYLAFVIMIGSVGNMICLIIYSRSRLLRRFRSTAYLKALAISDLWFVICLGLVWLKGLDIRWHDYPIVCPLSIYLSNTSSFLSAWYVMAMTAEMASTVRRACFKPATGGRVRLVIANGHGEQRLSTVTRLLFIAVLAMSLNGWTLAVTESVRIPDQMLEDKRKTWYHNSTPVPIVHWTYECRMALDSEHLYRTFNIMDTVLSFTIPLVITVILNVYIGYTIVTASKFRRIPIQEVVQPYNSDSSGISKKGSVSTTTLTTVFTRSTTPRRVSWRPSRRETTMAFLLAARSLAYIVLNVPNYAHRLHVTFANPISSESQENDRDTYSTIDNIQDSHGDSKQSEAFWQMIVYLLFYTQFALNVFIYSGRICLRGAFRTRTLRS